MQFRCVLEQGLEDLKQSILREHDLALKHSLTSLSCNEKGPALAIISPPARVSAFLKEIDRTLESSTPIENIEKRDSMRESEDLMNDNHSASHVSEDSCQIASVSHVTQDFACVGSRLLLDQDFRLSQTSSFPSSRIPTELSERVAEAWANFCLTMLTPHGRYQLLSSSKHEITLNAFWTSILTKPRMSGNDLMNWLSKPIRMPGRLSRNNRISRGLSDFFDPSFMHFYVFHPGSWQCLVWYSISLVFLVYDVIMVPLALGFDLADTDVQGILGMAARVFWTIDIPLHFCVGRYIGDFLEMSFRHSARLYIQTWFSLDLFLVSVDWTTLAMSGHAEGTSYVNLVRALRIARLARVLRLERMFAYITKFLESTCKTVTQGVRVVRCMLWLALWTHFMACAWHGVSYVDDSSWAEELHGSLVRKYFVAAHWSLSQVHGTTHSAPASTLEWGLASLALLMGLVLLSQFIGAVSHLVVLFADTSSVPLARSCGRYMEKKNIPSSIVRRARVFLIQRHRHVGLAEQLMEEGQVLRLFPEGLRAHILEATRGVLLKRIPFFELFMELDKRSCRSLCKDGFSEEMYTKDHVLFSVGDNCKHLYLVNYGAALYHHSLNEELPPVNFADLRSRLFKRTFELQAENNKGLLLAKEWGQSGIEGVKRRFGSQVLNVGANICEGALWSPWFNIGSLSTTCDSVLLALDVVEFERAATTFRQHLAFVTARYAREFVIQLKDEPIPSDLFAVEYSLEIAMNIEPDDIVDPFDHRMFLSHYKQEAGTEATLLHEGFTRMIAGSAYSKGHLGPDSAASTVFLDSEDLTNLAMLKLHVIGSANLVILLTPGFLTRPWCLAEIVYAWRCEIPIVPVEIQRPGLNFIYPQEEFFQKVHRGEFLDAKAQELFDQESISREDVVAALRHAFTEIALPFSPHKSQNIRETEMRNIVNRCLPLGFQVSSRMLMSKSESLQHSASVKKTASSKMLKLESLQQSSKMSKTESSMSSHHSSIGRSTFSSGETSVIHI